MQIEYRNFNPARKFGVEFEVNPNLSKEEITNCLKQFESLSARPKPVRMEGGDKGWAESLGNDYWHVKYDSTCGFLGKKKIDGGGWEVASYVACGMNDAIHISNLASYLNEAGAKTSESCGLHIHVDVEDFTIEQLDVLYAYWIKAETFLSHIFPQHRKKNKYCKSVRNKLDGYTEGSLFDWLRPKNLEVHENMDKRVTLNGVGIAKKFEWDCTTRCTVELRWPECELNKMPVYNWITFIVHFVNSCKHRKMPDSLEAVTTVDGLFDCLGLQVSKPDNFLILDQHLHLLKLWLLRRITHHGSTKKVIKDAEDKLVFLSRI